MCKKIISQGEPLSFTDTDISTFKRPSGIPAPDHVVNYNYFMWLMESVELNGPNEKQYYRLPDTDDKTYFILAQKMHNMRYNPYVPFDDNRISDGRRLREVYALFMSSYTDYSSLDREGASILEVLVALVERFDTEVMMTSEAKPRHKEWFWIMMKNIGLDAFTDASFMRKDSSADIMCGSILEIVNSREYDKSGLGGFFPLKSPKTDQRKLELWKQMHAYFLENLID